MIGDKIREMRKSQGMTQERLAERLRNEYHLKTDRATVGKWEIGIQIPELYTTACLAKIFGISLDELNQDEHSVDLDTLPSNILPLPKTYKVPLLGSIACGTPILAAENIETYVSVPDDIRCNFTLRCKGDSMIGARINDGDIVYIRQQPDVENGEIAAVLIDGMETEATLKRVYKGDGQITLMPANEKFPPFVYVGEDMNRVRIIGKAVAFVSAVR